jgi:hypothetical protein
MAALSLALMPADACSLVLVPVLVLVRALLWCRL